MRAKAAGAFGLGYTSSKQGLEQEESSDGWDGLSFTLDPRIIPTWTLGSHRSSLVWHRYTDSTV